MKRYFKPLATYLVAPAFLFSFDRLHIGLEVSSAQTVKVDAANAPRTCPTDPDELMGMVDELKGTFECGGFNLDECNQYRSGLIGGGIAASVAAGIGSLKSRPRLMACLLPGSTASLREFNLPTSGRYQVALRALSAFSKTAEAAPGSCNMPTKELAKEFTEMSREHMDEARRLRGDMIDAVLSQKVSPAMLEKVEVPDSAVRAKFLEGLEELEKSVRADSAGRISNPSSRDWYLDDIKRLKAQFRTGGSYPQMHEAFVKLSGNFMPSEVVSDIDSSTLQKLRVWDSRSVIRAEKIATLSDPALQAAYKKALMEVDTLTGMTQWSGRADYLKSLGYSKEVTEKLLEADGSRRQIAMRGMSLQGASYDLTYGRLKGKATLAASDLKDFMRTRHINFFDHPLLRFSHVPGMNSGLVKTVGSAGRAAMAKLSQVAAGDLATLTKYGFKGAAFVGSKAFAAVSETAFHMGAIDCRGNNPGVYVTEVYDSATERCGPSIERTEMTDAFLFGLSREEQLTEIRQGNGTCAMLLGLYDRYAPSQNWNLRCDGNIATLSGAGEDGAGQMVKFSTGPNGPQNLQWFSSDLESCANVTLKGGEFDTATAYEYENGTSCGTGDAERYTASSVWGRGPVTDGKKLIRQFSKWQKENSFAMTSAADCCQGRSSSLCPDGSGAGGTRVRTNRTTRTSK